VKNFDNIKGTYDYLPQKQVIRENIKNILQTVFCKYGFAPIETPILCKYDLLASKYSEGADILNEMYVLSDQGDRKLGLRYDLTITFSKLISLNSDVSLPFKRYEIGKVFRDGPVKFGRNREFTQCDIDVVGVKNMMAEAEYMFMISEVFDKLGLEVEILLNNRKLLSGIITYVFGNVSDEIMRKSIMLIDKFAKLTKEELELEFSKIGIDSSKLATLREILNSDYYSLKEKLSKIEGNNMIKEGLEEIDELYGLLEGSETLEKIVFAPYLARGIDVYTGTVWEVFIENKKINDNEFNVSISGGGRYDKIITDFVSDGNEYPAIGMSFGLDAIYEALTLKEEDKKVYTVELYIIPMNTQKKSFQLATALRQTGLKVDLDKNDRKLKKSMNYANKMNIPFVIILGEDEVKSNEIKLRNMDTGEEEKFSLQDIDMISKYIKEKVKA